MIQRKEKGLFRRKSYIFLVHKNNQGQVIHIERVAEDVGPYVSREHISIRKEGRRWYIKKLYDENNPAVYRKGRWYILRQKGDIMQLKDGDIIALAYNPAKGAYMQFKFELS